MKTGFTLCALVILGLLSACGLRDDADPTAVGVAEPTTTVPNARHRTASAAEVRPDTPADLPPTTASTPDPATSAAVDNGEQAEAAANATEKNEETAASETGPGPPDGIVTGIEPQCVTRGELVRVTVETEPFADLSYGAAFADGKHHNIFGVARAGPDGRYLLTFNVPADAALGDGQVIFAAAHPNGRGGEGRAPFRVTEKGNC